MRSMDWDARSYHTVSDPQFGWGLRVLERLELAGGEEVLDAGCGSGRLTARLAERLPRGRVVGLDLSQDMLRTARAALAAANAGNVVLVRGDVARLPFVAAFDAIFSTATFHWVLDHDALFGSIFAALRPGGRLLAQCGGGPNIARARARAAKLMAAPEFVAWFVDWRSPWHYATPEETAARLRAAGFEQVETGLEEAPATFPDGVAYEAFTSTVILRPYLARLPDDATRRAFTRRFAELAAADDRPFTLDYWRLNISAHRPRA